MKVSKFSYLFIYLFIYSLLGCVNLNENTTGSLSIDLPAVSRALPTQEESDEKDIINYKIVLSSDNLNIEKIALPGEKIEFIDLKTGSYNITCYALNNDGTAIYGSSKNTIVESGKTSQVLLTLTDVIDVDFTNTFISDTVTFSFFRNQFFKIPSPKKEWNDERRTFLYWENQIGEIYYPGDDCIYNGDVFSFSAIFRRAPTEIGYFAYDDSTTSKVLDNEKILVGIVLEVNDEGLATKIISLEQQNKKWCNGSAQCMYSYDEKEEDGSEIMAWFINEAGSSVTDNLPALAYARDFSIGSFSWYIPAKNELLAIYNNKDVLNNSLALASKTELGNSLYWSSTIIDDADVWVYNFYTGSSNEYPKYDTYEGYVRCIAQFDEDL